MQEVDSYLDLGQGYIGSMKSWVGIEGGKGVLCMVLSILQAKCDGWSGF